MKKINSIGYGHKIIALAFLFLVVVPLFCRLLSFVAATWLLAAVMQVSFIIGASIAFFFIILLAIEFRQDKAIDKRYATVKRTKMSIGNGIFECQLCGSRQVTESSVECSVCGNIFIVNGGK